MRHKQQHHQKTWAGEGKREAERSRTLGEGCRRPRSLAGEGDGRRRWILAGEGKGLRRRSLAGQGEAGGGVADLGRRRERRELLSLFPSIWSHGCVPLSLLPLFTPSLPPNFSSLPPIPLSGARQLLVPAQPARACPGRPKSSKAAPWTPRRRLGRLNSTRRTP